LRGWRIDAMKAFLCQIIIQTGVSPQRSHFQDEKLKIRQVMLKFPVRPH
jgi:hypothetical protein